MNDQRRQRRALASVAIVAAALLALLAVSALLSLVPLGRWGLAAGLVIAGVKAAMVAWWFMDLRRAPATVWFTALAALLWLGMLAGGTMADLWTRPEGGTTGGGDAGVAGGR